jgi:hypothetical protein
MACGSGSNIIEGWAWAAGDTTPEVFAVLTEAMSVASVESFRAEFELRNRSGDIEIKRGYQYSDDGLTWDTAVAYDTASWVSTEGFNMPTAYANTDVTRRWIRFGIIGRSAAASDNECARVTLTLDLKNR